MGGSITSESYRHQGTLVRACSDDARLPAPSPALVWGVCGSVLSSVYQVSQELLCEAVTHQFQEAMYLWDLQKKDLKAIFRFFFFLVIYRNCFSQQNGWGNSTYW